jgi:hypothetical protein
MASEKRINGRKLSIWGVSDMRRFMYDLYLRYHYHQKWYRFRHVYLLLTNSAEHKSEKSPSMLASQLRFELVQL